MSWFALIGQTILGDEFEIAMIYDPDSIYWTGFDAFLEAWSAPEIQIDGVTHRRLSQWGQLVDADGTLLTNDLGRFENLAQDLARIFQKIGMEYVHTPVMNATTHRHYSAYYSDYGRELVRDAFHDDIAHLGYRFEDSQIR